MKALTPWQLIPAVMPEGVEHLMGVPGVYNLALLIPTVMPEGVEHFRQS